jgi:hypothetical protein
MSADTLVGGGFLLMLGVVAIVCMLVKLLPERNKPTEPQTTEQLLAQQNRMIRGALIGAAILILLWQLGW